jgi:microcystin-dependent protein
VPDQYLAEIRLFPFGFVPAQWMSCDGQLLPISQFSALFSLLGTTFGGNGRTNFALPDLSGRVPMQPGQGPGLTMRRLGEEGGETAVTVLSGQIPAHTHAISASAADGGDRSPANERFAVGTGGVQMYAPPGAMTQLAPQAWPPAGGGVPHNNMQPYLALHFCIAIDGEFPARPE